MSKTKTSQKQQNKTQRKQINHHQTKPRILLPIISSRRVRGCGGRNQPMFAAKRTPRRAPCERRQRAEPGAGSVMKLWLVWLSSDG